MYLNIYENKTDANIRKDMLDKVTAPVNKMEGTLIYDALSPVANELSKLYIEMNILYGKNFIENIEGNELDLKADECGLTRKQATKSIGSIKITGEPGTIIPIDFLVSTDSNLQFRTTEPSIINSYGYAIAKIESYEPGENYNVSENTIIRTNMFLNGITSITNEKATTDGAYAETDAELKARLLYRIKNPGTSGNIHHYRQWAIEVEGCGDAKVIPLWNGAGTVKVIIIDSSKEPASSEIITAVEKNIEDLRPVGADVTVVSAVNKIVNVSLKLKLNGLVGLDIVKNDIQKKIEEYLKSIAFLTSYVSIARIGAIILNIAGVSDYDSLKLNEDIIDIDLNIDEVARLGEVTVNV